MQPAFRHGAVVDARERRGVDAKLGRVIVNGSLEILAGQGVRFEIDDPHFPRANHGQIDGALDDNEFSLGQGGGDARGDKIRVGEPAGEGDFAMHGIGVCAKLLAEG